MRCIGQSVGTENELRNQLQPLVALETPSSPLTVQSLGFLDAVKHFAGPLDYESDLHESQVRLRADAARFGRHRRHDGGRRVAASGIVLLCDSYGGKIADVAADATAFPRRAGTQYCIQYYSSWTRAADTPAHLAQVARVYAAMRPHMPGASYVNYCDLDLPDYATAYWGDNLGRLVAVKQQYDPENVFHHAQSVPLTATGCLNRQKRICAARIGNVERGAIGSFWDRRVEDRQHATAHHRHAERRVGLRAAAAAAAGARLLRARAWRGRRHDASPRWKRQPQGSANAASRRCAISFPIWKRAASGPTRPRSRMPRCAPPSPRPRDAVPGLPLIAGGKSFGGRMTSQAQALAPLAGVRGLAFLRLPAASGRKTIQRARQTSRRCRVPMLFLQGTRDALAELNLLEPVVRASVARDAASGEGGRSFLPCAEALGTQRSRSDGRSARCAGSVDRRARLSLVVPANAGTHNHRRIVEESRLTLCPSAGRAGPRPGRLALALHPGYDASMTNILIVNPNTTSSMTETIGVAARAVAAQARNNRRNIIDGAGLDRRVLRRSVCRAGTDPGVSEPPMPMPALSPASMTPGSMPRDRRRAFPGGRHLRGGAGDRGATGKTHRGRSPRCRARSCRSKNWCAAMALPSGRGDGVQCRRARPRKAGFGRCGEARTEIARALDNGAEAIVLGCAGMADLAATLSQKFAFPSSTAWQPR